MMMNAIRSDAGVAPSWVWRSYAGLLVVVGVTMLTGGGLLAGYGGSLYYLIAGLLLGLTGVLIWREDRRGVGLYAVLFAGSLAWAIWEVGLQPWGLIARLAALGVLGFPLLLRRARSSTA